MRHLSSKQSGCERGSSPCDENEVCIPNYEENSANCLCREGYIGKPCSKCLRIIDPKLGGSEFILAKKALHNVSTDGC